jgi:glycosyltransferase involved in cell wall biosynthesis
MIPNGLDIKELKGVKYEPDPEEIRVLYVGRLVRNKNVDKLIQMIKILLTSSRFNNLKLVIVGDGSFKPKLLKLAKQLGVERHIEWKEYLSRRDLLHEYSRAKVFILPSQIEAFGIAAAEAIVIGVPTIVAKAGALIEYVKAGLARGIDLPVSGQAIASKVIEVMEDHTDTTSRSKGDYFYSWDEVVERILIAYRNCLG